MLLTSYEYAPFIAYVPSHLHPVLPTPNCMAWHHIYLPGPCARTEGIKPVPLCLLPRRWPIRLLGAIPMSVDSGRPRRSQQRISLESACQDTPMQPKPSINLVGRTAHQLPKTPYLRSVR